ncbi:MAG: hypothetical protein DME50_03505 [Verrucomicrobia bacterium]|nr:MAG: hypothetical protein DME50_03505 [Verrucomicrobiota bacterium]
MQTRYTFPIIGYEGLRTTWHRKNFTARQRSWRAVSGGGGKARKGNRNDRRAQPRRIHECGLGAGAA